MDQKEPNKRTGTWEATAFLMTDKPNVASSGRGTWKQVMRWVEGYAQAANSDTLDRIEIQRKPELILEPFAQTRVIFRKHSDAPILEASAQ